MRLCDTQDGYDYICTHVDNFKMVAKDPDYWLLIVKEHFLVKSARQPNYYLGIDFCFEDNKGLWTVSSKTYAAKAVGKVGNFFCHSP